jgi:hypothetical protein
VFRIRSTFPTLFERTAFCGPPFCVDWCVDWRAKSFIAEIWSQSNRAGADLRTTNRPDARSKVALAEKKNRKKKKQPTVAGAVFHSVRKHSDYLGYRAGVPGTGSTSSMPILIGAVLIAVAILLSTLVTALGTRYVGIEGPTEESAWLVDRLTGSVYRCQAPERGKATCEAETATGSIAGRQKQGR